jgi:hypothetical protein
MVLPGLIISTARAAMRRFSSRFTCWRAAKRSSSWPRPETTAPPRTRVK